MSGAMVSTKDGLLPRSALKTVDIVTETDNSRCIATEWYYNGELVRRDAWANILRSDAMAPAQAAFS